MIRVLVALIGGLMLAGIVHIVTVFGVPRHAVVDPWTQVSTLAPETGFQILPPAEAGKRMVLSGLDPAMRHALCRFGLDAGPIRFKAQPGDGWWILALYDRRGLPVYSLDDRAAAQKGVDVLVASAAQIARLRENPPEELEDVVVVDWKDAGGFALLKIFVAQPSLAGEVDRALATATCTPMALP